MIKELYAAKYADICSLHDPLSIIGLVFWPWAEADRFDILNKYSPYNFVVDKSIPLPNLHQEKKRVMRDLCLERAISILEKARRNNKKLLILWSGGVDSTSIITSFILAGATNEDIIICCTQKSINEYQRGYLILKNQFKFKIHLFEWSKSVKLYESFGDSVYFITGWCADQLFGSNVNQVFPECYKLYWKDGLKSIIEQTFNRLEMVKGYDDQEINNAIESFDMYSKKLNVELKYTCDALWLFNFGIKWSHVSRDFALTLNNNEQRKNIINFYDSIGFQEWSLQNYKSFSKHNQATEPKYYKRELKEIIYEVFKDKDYLDNKGKYNSWISFVYGKRYDPFKIWDAKDGIITYDIELSRFKIREFMIPYLKDNIDQEKFLTTQLL